MDYVLAYISQNISYFRDKLSGHRLYDIGGTGRRGDILADMTALPPKLQQSVDEEDRVEYMGLGITELVHINLFEFFIFRKPSSSIETACAPTKTIYSNTGGLAYLIYNSENSSGNVLTSGLNYNTIRNPEYHEALVREILKVVPEGGIYLSYHSAPLEKIAEQFVGRGFKNVRKDGLFHIFEK